MASTIKNFFRKKQLLNGGTGKNGEEAEFEQKSNKLHRGASFRLSLYRKQSPPERLQKPNGSVMSSTTEQADEFPYKSPYDVVTEPKSKRAIRSCPGGNVSRSSTLPVENRNFQQFDAIHEQSGSYENFPAFTVPESVEEMPKSVSAQVKAEKSAQLLRLRQPPHRPRLSRNPNVQQPQQMSTSEYGSGSAEPSPINEQQQLHQQVRSQSKIHGQSFEYRPKPDGFHYGYGNSSDEDDEDEDSSEEDSISNSFLQFWQQQVKMLKREARSYREAAEKYRNKYHRLKSRTDELNSELTRERERNISLFNQLLIANEKIVQLAQLQQKGQQASVVPFELRKRQDNPWAAFMDVPLQNPFLLHSSNKNPMQQPYQLKSPAQYGAGEMQCPIKDIHGICNSPAGSDQEAYIGMKKLAENGKKQPFLEQMNFQHLNYQDGLEKPRSENEKQEQPFLSPSPLTADPIGMGQNHDSAIKVDLNKIQNDCKHGFNGSEESIIIELDDLMNSQNSTGVEDGNLREMRKHSYSSDDVSNKAKKNFSAGLSSSDDDITKLWNKQLVKKGDRIIFRPPRKSLFLGTSHAGDKDVQRVYKRFGKFERAALSNFDYLRDEKSDVSGLASSPEKAERN